MYKVVMSKLYIYISLIISRYLVYLWRVLLFVLRSVVSQQLYKEVESPYTNVNMFLYCANSILALRM